MADEDVMPGGDVSTTQSDFVRRWLIRLAVLTVVFLLGFVPMWVVNWRTSLKLDHARANVHLLSLETHLAAAAIYSRRGDYEIGRQEASTFFTALQWELGKSDSTIFTEQEKAGFTNLLNDRDDVITLLSRSDPASADRLSALYVAYRSSLSGTRVSQ
jgi:hypothetical protein